MGLGSLSLDLSSLRAAYARGEATPEELVGEIYRRLGAHAENAIWITLVPQAEAIARARALEDRCAKAKPDELPLYGVPFAVKDNIDVAGLPTTAACPAFAYTPKRNAFVIERLLQAGALLIGKTNLDQFATGLSGTRSPYGVGRNLFNGAYIAGGSSSGSALAVASGLASFALGTDTAGSGRVPAAFSNIVGLKPTRGLLSNRGVVPACRSLDCISVLALTCGDALRITDLAAGFDPEDPFSRSETVSLDPQPVPGSFRFGVPEWEQLDFFGDSEFERLYQEALQRLETLGGQRVEFDFRPFREVGALLYHGPWVAERQLAVRELFKGSWEALHPVVREIVERGATFSATDAFAAYHRLRSLMRKAAQTWAKVDLVALPTVGTIYRVEAMLREPVALNVNLGYYTHCANLMDLCAIAVPSGFTTAGLPFGIAFLGPAYSESLLCALGAAFHARADLQLGATTRSVSELLPPSIHHSPRGLPLCVCGGHMSGLGLNHELTSRGARLLKRSRTALCYRLYALESMSPARPGLIRKEPGHGIEVEVWDVPWDQIGGFIAGIPAPLTIGSIELEDGEQVKGFLCEAHAVVAGLDISTSGSWRRYLAERSASPNRPT